MSFKLSSIIFICVSVLFCSCSKKDKTAPEITLKGNAYIVISLNSHFTDPGATANDDFDGLIKVTASDTVNTNFAGTYNITYSATDASGNEASVTRTVVVQNDSYSYNGNYSDITIIAPDTTFYTASLATSNIKNNRVWLVGYSNADNAAVYADVRNDTILIPHQIVSAGSPVAIHAYAGNGFIKTISNHTVLEISFTDSVAGNIKNGVSVYTKTN